MKKKKLNKKRVFYAVIILITIALVTALGVKLYMDFGTKQEAIQTKKELDEIKPYGYKLDDSDTAIYKTYFKELNDLLSKKEIDQEKYSELLTKLFVIDFYTLDNKLTSTDIGGLEFIHQDMVENFKINAQENMYKSIKSNIYGDRTQELPIVKDVEITSKEKTTYTYNQEKYEAYKVDTTWSYEKDLGYETKASFILIEDNKKLNLVEKIED